MSSDIKLNISSIKMSILKLSYNPKILGLRITTHRLVYLSVLIYAMCIMIDPTDLILHLKIPLFALCLCAWGCDKFKIEYNWEIGIFLLLILIGAYGVVRGFCVTHPIDEEYQDAFLKVLILNLLIFPIGLLSYGEQERIFYYTCMGLTIALIMTYIAFCFLGFGTTIYSFIHGQARDTIMISNRVWLGIPILAFFHKACPILLFGVAHKISTATCRKDWLLAIVMALPMILCGSRTPLLCALILIVVVSAIRYRISPAVKYMGGIFFIAIFILAILKFLSDSEDGSILLKFGSLANYIDDMATSWSTLLWGGGVGSYVMIPGRGLMSHSELSFVDLYHMYGVIFGTIFTSLIMAPGLLALRGSYDKRVRAFGVAYILYMIVANTNPLLFSSTGWFVVICGMINLFKFKIDAKL